jgi:DNA-binding CsgD family transcriptional regulator
MSLPSFPVAASVEHAITALRRNYRDTVRLSAREEILAELAKDSVTGRLHADTARFHHGSARAYARSLELLVGEELDLFEDKEKVRASIREADLAHMRCQGRRYRAFDPSQL